MKKGKILTAIAVAAMLAMSVTACGGGSSSAAPATEAPKAATEAAADTEAADDAEEDTEEYAEEDTEEYAEEDTEAADDTEAAEETQAATTDLSQLNDILTVAYQGMIDDEGVMLYGRNDDNSLAVCAAYDPNTNNYISFVGPIEMVSDTQAQITDNSTGNTLTFTITPKEDGTVELSMGDFGTAIVVESDVADVVEKLQRINEGSNPLA